MAQFFSDLTESVRAWMPKERTQDLIYLDIPNPEQKIGFNPLKKVS